MSDGITPGQIRQNNRMRIYHYIYNRKNVSQADICRDLGISRPTVASQLAALENDGLIRHSGIAEQDQVGRKAGTYAITEQYRLAAGAHLSQERLSIRVVDLYGRTVREKVLDLPYVHSLSYYRSACSAIRRTIDSLSLPEGKLLGVGIALPGRVSPDGRKVVYGKLLGNTGLTAEELSRETGYPCLLLQDTEAAAAREMSLTPEMDNALYLSLSRHIGAVLISGRRIVSGRNGHGIMPEHLPIRLGGRICYCGRHGCLETECSVSTFLPQRTSLASFFSRLRAGDEQASLSWKQYLARLSRSLCQLLLLYDTEIILGGELSSYLQQEDFRVLYRNIGEQFLYEVPEDYLSLARAQADSLVSGAALPLIWNFLGSPDQ